MSLQTTPPPLWRHQREAIEQCLPRRGSLLHMGLGTGKTRVAIELADRWGAKTLLVVCPLSVATTWEKEINEYSERGWKVLDLTTQGPVKGSRIEAATAALRAASCVNLPLMIVINYESAYREPLGKWFRSVGFDCLIVDESHRLKAHAGVQSRYIWSLSQTVGRVVALTGTPMPHGPLDAFAQFRFIDSTLFGTSFFRFRARYAQMGGYGGHEVVGYLKTEELAERIASATYTVGRDVLELPPATHQMIPVRLGKKARAAYDQFQNALTVEIEEGEITAANALVRLLRLQQLTGGFVKTDDGEHTIDTAKQDALAELLSSVDDAEPFVVFGQFRSDLAAIHRAAESLGRKSAELSGRVNQLSEWQAGGAPILAVQIHSGGTGVNLTRAAYVAYFSTGFNGGDFEQSLARSHRPGQDRHVAFYHLHAADTIDAQVYRALMAKKNAVDAILDTLHTKETTR